MARGVRFRQRNEMRPPRAAHRKLNRMDLTRIGVSIVVSILLSYRGYRKKSLSLSGAIAAFATGFVHTMAGYTFTVLLGVFFFTASWLTKYKSQEKAKIEEDFKEGTTLLNTGDLSVLLVCV